MRITSIIKSVVLYLAILFVAMASIVIFLLSTTPGLYVTTHIIGHFLPGKLDVTAIKSDQPSELSFEKLRYVEPNLTVELQDVRWHWRLRDILHRRFTITDLQVNYLSWVNTNKAKKNLPPPPHLPIAIIVEKINITSLLINQDEVTISLKNLQLGAQLNAQQWRISPLNFSWNKHRMRLNAHGAFATPYPIDASLNITPEKGHNQPIKGHIVITGNALKRHWQGHFKNPGIIDLEGTLSNETLVHSQITWQQFNWLDKNLLSDKGKITLDGVLSNIKLEANANFTAPIQSALSISAKSNLVEKTVDAKLALGNNTLNIVGNPNAPWQVTANIPTPSLLHPSLKGLDTVISAKAVFDNAQKGNASVTIGKGRFQDENRDFLFEGGELQALLTPKNLQGSGLFTIDASQSLRLNFALPQFNLTHITPDQKIVGDVSLKSQSLSFLQNINPIITAASGQLLASLHIEGLIKKPTITGSIDVKKASISMEKIGIVLSPIDLSVQSLNQQWHARGSIVSNGHPLTISGDGHFTPTLDGTVNLIGDHIPVIATREYVINLSPNITLGWATSLLKIRGTLQVVQSQIAPQSFTNSVGLSDDAVFITKEAPPSTPYPIDADVQVVVGDKVAIAMKGLQGVLTGKVQLQQTPQKALTATGGLSVRDGQYKAYGQDLKISEGQLLFSGGSIDNPEIRIRAFKKFNNAANSFSGSNKLFDFNPDNVQSSNLGNKTTVGIEVVGRINAPKIQLFSIPSNLSQADILSLLLLGKPASQVSKSGGQLLLTAVSALNLDNGAKGLQLLKQLKDNLGVDFNVETNSEYNQKTNQSSDKTAFVVGKALSRRLYLSYNMGLSQTDSNMVSLKYLLNKFFSIQVSASMTESGIDLLYTHHHKE